MQFLVPIILLTLTKQEEYDDEDDWNPCKAAGVCLSLMANYCEDAIVPLVMPFVREHLQNPQWQWKDAAIVALGSILEGPDPNVLQQHVMEIMGPLIDLMDDPMVQVRDSAVWTLGRVCEQVPAAVLSEQNEQQEIKEQKEQYLLKLLDGLCRGLQGEPRVATNSCWVRM